MVHSDELYSKTLKDVTAAIRDSSVALDASKQPMFGTWRHVNDNNFEINYTLPKDMNDLTENEFCLFVRQALQVVFCLVNYVTEHVCLKLISLGFNNDHSLFEQLLTDEQSYLNVPHLTSLEYNGKMNYFTDVQANLHVITLNWVKLNSCNLDVVVAGVDNQFVSFLPNTKLDATPIETLGDGRCFYSALAMALHDFKQGTDHSEQISNVRRFLHDTMIVNHGLLVRGGNESKAANELKPPQPTIDQISKTVYLSTNDDSEHNLSVSANNLSYQNYNSRNNATHVDVYLTSMAWNCDVVILQDDPGTIYHVHIKSQTPFRTRLYLYYDGSKDIGHYKLYRPRERLVREPKQRGGASGAQEGRGGPGGGGPGGAFAENKTDVFKATT